MIIIFYSFILLIFSIIFDVLLGEPYNVIHPVVFTGNTIYKFNKYFRKIKSKKSGGLIFLIFIIIINVLPVMIILYLLFLINNIISEIAFIIIYVYFLKSTFSIKSMKKHINRIIDALNKNDINKARINTSMVVRRNTENMDKYYISSAAIETTAEGFVDGYFTPLFFYSFFGIIGSLIIRIINTMDSNIAYKDDKNYEFGRATAIADTLTNYIPSRLTPYIFKISAFVLKYKYKKFKIINTTDSLNAGYSIDSMAFILNVRLEKVGEYIVNENGKLPDANDIRKSLNIYYLSCFISLFIFVLPLSVIMTFLFIYV